MATVAQPCPSWTRASIPVPRRTSQRRFIGRTSLACMNPQPQARAAVVEATPSSSRDRSSQVLTLPVNRAGELQAEARAMACAANATVYNPSRTLQILTALGSFGLKLLLDQKSGVLDQNRRVRASELKTIFTQHGPTFVKLGQKLGYS